MVHPENDPDQPRTTYAYDPHIDPALMFDNARARIEKVIDEALASGDADTMKEALLELKRMQAPYLNWAGKAERTSFEIDTVSLHVHERVDPATILANARKRLKGEKAGEVWRQADLFAAPFENLPLRQAVDFYRHEKGWSNRLIAGDSLLVMNSLLQKESMAGKVQMIYIDPPYGIKYGSNFQPFTNQKDVKDGSDDDLTQEPEMIKAFRDTWELGIHSYLTYLRDRLMLAKELRGARHHGPRRSGAGSNLWFWNYSCGGGEVGTALDHLRYLARCCDARKAAADDGQLRLLPPSVSS